MNAFEITEDVEASAMDPGILLPTKTKEGYYDVFVEEEIIF